MKTTAPKSSGRFRARSERLEDFNNSDLKAKAMVWPWPSYLCGVRSTAVECGCRVMEGCMPEISFRNVFFCVSECFQY